MPNVEQTEESEKKKERNEKKIMKKRLKKMITGLNLLSARELVPLRTIAETKRKRGKNCIYFIQYVLEHHIIITQNVITKYLLSHKCT